MIASLKSTDKTKNIKEDDLCMGNRKKLTQFSIEAIVGEKKQLTLDETIMSSKKLRLDNDSKNVETKNESASNLYVKIKNGINITQFKNNKDSILSKDVALTKKIPKKVLNVDQNDDFMFRDKSSEVKHALTPIIDDKIPNHSCSPQLPAPSPNYPVQSCTISESNNNNSNINNPLPQTTATISHKKLNKNSKKQIETMKKSAIQESNFTILNIPNIPVKAKRQRLSKIDLATRKRLNRKKEKKKRNPKSKSDKVSVEYGIMVYGYSDGSDSDVSLSSDSDSSDVDIDLVIKNGPPLEMDSSPFKMNFLKTLQLTTHRMKNFIELQKLQKRKWLDPCTIQETSKEKTVSLNLPVPLKSTLTLSMLQNYKAKKAFYQLLGLKIVSAANKQELEKNWLEVVKDRLKRNCESSVTKFTEKLQKITSEKNDRLSIDNKINEEHLKLPITHQYKIHNLHIDRKQDCKNFINPDIGTNNPLPLSTISLGNRFSIKTADKLDGFKENISVVKEDFNNSYKWPGIANIIEAYKKYSKDRNDQSCQLRKRQSMLVDENSKKQKEVRSLERRQRELCSILFRRENEKRELQSSIDQLKNCINPFR
ncbi:unnamed protein product [Psylliodes chrysocephalus]|uniref:Genetic suppressor element-like domain-containing protein n=1 Tax=Psylliodes chrysocephalus TaxID=3402493 RepID=A0A9P0GJT2_9CUCU|nr:unnamed protein product [Psylliodes chrysocephala]